MRKLFLIVISAILVGAPALATVTAKGADSFDISMEQGSIKDTIVDLLKAAKKDYIMDSASPGPDIPSAQGATATMNITNAKLGDALQILMDAGSWSADARDDGRYLISWTGEAPPPSKVHVQRADDGKGFVIAIDPMTSTEEAIRGIWQQTGAKVLVDQRARNEPVLIHAPSGAEGAFSAVDIEQAIRYVATPNFTVQRAGETIIVSARDMSARCACGQALDKNWKFCPACGKAAPASEAGK
jgi:hypothetical protein